MTQFSIAIILTVYNIILHPDSWPDDGGFEASKTNTFWGNLISLGQKKEFDFNLCENTNTIPFKNFFEISNKYVIISTLTQIYLLNIRTYLFALTILKR